MITPPRILAVEDREANLALLRAVLRRAADDRLRNADLQVATTLEDARRAIVGGSFAIVLLDMRLPDGSGLELIPDLEVLTPRPRVVVLTANALPADEIAARDAGAHEFVTKPYDPARLMAVLVRLLDIP